MSHSTTNHHSASPVGLPRRLTVAFVIGAFALGASENVIAGIIPGLAESLSVPVAAIGLLVTAYAGTAVIAGPLLSVFTSKVPLRRLAIGSLVAYGMATVFAAIAPNYGLLVAARIAAGSMHTSVLVAFMLAAVRLSCQDERGRAVGLVTFGLGVATVAGVPLGNAVAEIFGWQWAFVLIAVLIGIALVLVIVSFPQGRAPRGESSAGSLRVFRSRPVIGGIAMTALAALGAMLLLAYVVPYLQAAGALAQSVAPLLLVYGVGCLIGNVIGGRLADRSLVRSLAFTLSATTAALALAGLLGSSLVGATIGLTAVGIAYFSTFPPLNTWIGTQAEGTAPDLALALNSSAFNIGIAAAGGLGGTALTAGLPPRGLAVFGIIAVLAAIVIWAMTVRPIARRQPASGR